MSTYCNLRLPAAFVPVNPIVISVPLRQEIVATVVSTLVRISYGKHDITHAIMDVSINAFNVLNFIVICCYKVENTIR